MKKPNIEEYNLKLDEISELKKLQAQRGYTSFFVALIITYSLMFIYLSWQYNNWEAVLFDFKKYILYSLPFSWIVIIFLGTFINELYKPIRWPALKNLEQYTKDLNKYRKVMSEKLFESFINESIKTSPYSEVNPKATLFRHAWRRAVVLKSIYKHLDMQDEERVHDNFAVKCSQIYNSVAPENMYGKIRLQITDKQFAKLYQKEIDKVLPPAFSPETRHKSLACIYLGVDQTGKMYIGQTQNEPEIRWKQHRKEQTGPYKTNEDYVDWKVIEGNINFNDLDSRESYYIGYYDSYENGHNENKGNSAISYENGVKKRLVKEFD